MAKSIYNQIVENSLIVKHHGISIDYKMADYLQGMDKTNIDSVENAVEFFGSEIALNLIHCGLQKDIIDQRQLARPTKDGFSVEPDEALLQQKIAKHKPASLPMPESKQDKALKQLQALKDSGVDVTALLNSLN